MELPAEVKADKDFLRFPEPDLKALKNLSSEAVGEAHRRAKRHRRKPRQP
jgi:hypothetical protein